MASAPGNLISAEELRRGEIAYELRQLIEEDIHSSAKMRRLANRFDVSIRTLYRYRALLQNGGLVSSALAPRKPGPKWGFSRYSPTVDEVVHAVIKGSGLTLQNLPVSELLNLVHDECRRRGLDRSSWPGLKGVQTRFDQVEVRTRKLRREGRKAAEPFTARPDEFPATTRPNQIWLIDHTLADIILVDRIYRRTLGRPTFTAIIDAYTRMIAGYYVSLGRPSRVQTAMALLHAVMSKDAWLAEKGLEYPWPIFGLPDVLHADNAAEFHSGDLLRGCNEHHIKPTYRPPAEPRYGALIERFIGTTMGKVHVLPGTTFSNVQQRGDYDSGAKAIMTLDDFDRWLALQIVEYHSTQHAGIDRFTPISRWMAAAS